MKDSESGWMVKGEEDGCFWVLLSFPDGEDSVGRRVHPEKRSVSWVNSVLRQFLPHGPTAGRYYTQCMLVVPKDMSLLQGTSNSCFRNPVSIRPWNPQLKI